MQYVRGEALYYTQGLVSVHYSTDSDINHHFSLIFVHFQQLDVITQ